MSSVSQEKEYEVDLEVTGYYRAFVKASSPEEAIAKADKECNEADFGDLANIEWNTDSGYNVTLIESHPNVSTVDISKVPEKNILEITKERIAAGLKAGLIRLIESPQNDGVVCSIGKQWFYFGGTQAEESTVDEYIRDVPQKEIIDKIYDVLFDLSYSGFDYWDAYKYCSLYLQEHGV